MARGENKNGNSQENSFGRFFKLFISASLISGLTFAIILTELVQASENKSLNKSFLAGENIGGLDSYEVAIRLSSKVNNLQNKKFVLGNTTTSIKELGLEIDTKSLEDQLFIHNLNFTQKAMLVFNSLSTQNQLKISLIENLASQEKINKLTKHLDIEPENAYFAYNNKLEIIPDKKGKTPKTEKIISDIAVALSNNSHNVNVSYEEKSADITTTDLEKVYPRVQHLISRGLTLEHNSKIWNFSEKDLLAWIKITKNNNTVSTTFDDEMILGALEKIAPNINIISQKQIQKSDGTITQEGKNGLAVNKEQALKQTKQALESGIKQITIPTSEVKFATSTVYPDSTAGLYSGKYIQVSLKTQTLYQYEGENLIAQYTISSGAASTPTPKGTFTVNSKHPRAWSNSAKLWMPYWMAFIGSTYGLHELPEWPNGYKEGQNHLGIPVSHGCIRLGVGDAKKIYEWIEVGTPIVIN